MRHCIAIAFGLLATLLTSASRGVRAADFPELTPASEAALDRGLAWLARNQGPEGNWESNDLGLVAMGSLAYLAAGHMPGRGKYGDTVERSLDYLLRNAQPSGLLNVADRRRDMYNHGLAAFVLGQAHGMSGDPRIGPTLDRALRLIAFTQCGDGGWDYVARKQQRGHDLSLAVMQAKALRSAVDSGFEVRPEVIRLAIQSVRGYYRADGQRGELSEVEQRQRPGQFTYAGNRGTVAMAAAGVVCLQEFGAEDDWRIPKNLEVIVREVESLPVQRGNGHVPFDAYTLYYVAQALYQAGGEPWERSYPILRDRLVEAQVSAPGRPDEDGRWYAVRHVGGQPANLYGTAVACFVLAIPNRYLPILQEGGVRGLGDTLGEGDTP